MIRRVAVVAAALAAAALFLWLIGEGERVRSPLDSEGLAKTATEARGTSESEGLPEGRSEVLTEGPPRELRIAVRAAESGAPLSESVVHFLDASDASLPSDSVGYHADQDGVVHIPNGEVPSSERVIVASCKGRISRSSPIPRDSDAASRTVVLHLSSGNRLTVNVRTDDGLPVSEAWITVKFSPFGSASALQQPAHGNPSSSYAVWVAESDVRGVAAFDGLPSRRLWLSARHPLYGPSSLSYVNQVMNLDEDRNATIVLSSLYGSVYEPYEALEITQVLWDIDYQKLSIYGGVFDEASAHAAQHLGNRFPGALTFVHRPRDVQNPPIITCRAVDKEGRMWFAAAPMRKLSMIEEPVYMQAMDGELAQEVRLRIRTPAGRFLGSELSLRHTENELRLQATTGRTLHLPLGKYAVTTIRAGRSMWDAVSGSIIDVSGGGLPVQDIVIEIPDELIPITIEPVFVGRRGLCPVHLQVDPESGRGSTIANWDAASKELMIAAPPGRLELIARSVGYEDESTSVVVDDSADEVRVQLRLRERVD